MWIGYCIIILPRITIGDNAIIGVGSAVLKSIPSEVMAVGNSCVVKMIIDEEIHNSEFEG